MTDKCRRRPDNYKSALPSTKLRVVRPSSRPGRAARDRRLFRTTTQLRGDRSLPSPVVTCVVRLIGRRRGAAPHGMDRRHDRPESEIIVALLDGLCARNDYRRTTACCRKLPSIGRASVRHTRGATFDQERGFPTKADGILLRLVRRSLTSVRTISDPLVQALTSSGVYRKRFCLHTRTFSALRRFDIQIYVCSTFLDYVCRQQAQSMSCVSTKK